MDIPVIGQTVVSLSRKGNLRYGEVIGTRDDGRQLHIIVEYSESLRVEYPMSRWRDSFWPESCAICDGESHSALDHNFF